VVDSLLTIIDNDDPIGLYTVTATDGSNTAYTTFTDAPKVSSVSVSPTSNTVTAGGSVTYTVTVYRGLGQDSFDATLSIDGTLPNGTTAIFNPNHVSFSSTSSKTSTLTIQTSTTTPSGTYIFQVKATRNNNTSDNAISGPVTLIVYPPQDTTPPVIQPIISGTLGNNGWYVNDVTVSWDVSDPESGIASSNGCDTVTIDYDTTGETLTCSATNGAGLSDSVSVTIKRDATPPTVNILGISNGQQFDFGDTLPPVTCYATDNLSGIESCTITPEQLPTSVGTHTITATAKDKAGNEAAGNEATASIQYTIVVWTIKGFYQPVDMNDVVNVAKAGSTIPLKLEVFKTLSGTELTDTSIVKPLKAQRINCININDLSTDEIELTATGSTSLRYDPIEGQFIYNWKTPSQSNTCWKVILTTIDGSSIYALFRLR